MNWDLLNLDYTRHRRRRGVIWQKTARATAKQTIAMPAIVTLIKSAFANHRERRLLVDR
jgi:DNA primase